MKYKTSVALAKSLLTTATDDLAFLENLEITTNSASKIMPGYYDVLRSILGTIFAVEGYKSYSHEASAFFLREKMKA